MITNLRGMLAESPPMEVNRLIKLMGIAVIEDQYQALVDKALSKSPNFLQRKPLLNLGFFLGADLVQLMHEMDPPSDINAQVVSSLINQSIDWTLVSDSGILVPNGYVRYQWNKKRIAMFLALKCLDNVLLGPSYIAKKYHQSVPPIFVTKNGDKHTGTGFLATNRIDNQDLAIITAKHNVDPAEGIIFNEIGAIQGLSYKPLQLNWILHPRLDIALMPVSCDGPAIPILPLGTPSLLSRTITLGYPRIATTDGPYMLAHGGEINADVTSYYGENHLIISNIVAPGNSGGPVLDEAGLCIGMVVRALENKYEGGESSANAAIPSRSILEFMTSYYVG